ncbi:ImmA/IrrE family metallo-endopeptidase [Kordiimonas sp.]|uniref:ImmA/IrrE family metallo-endopeptidase n=1 Tax=Kordiimonas sp. TaxID=1970157 RepID=UPI003A928EF7
MTDYVCIPPIKEANRITGLWRNHGPNTYPINLSLVVEHIVNPTLEGERLHLVYSEFDTFEGMLKTDDEKKWGAFVNTKIPYKGRRNFTAAHEIFHFLAHRKIMKEFRCGALNLSDYQRDQMEVEANEFASQLLLPPDLVRPHVEEDFTYSNVRSLSDDMGVSVSALAYKWLSLTTKPMAFFQSRDGFILQGYASAAAYRHGIFFKEGREVPEASTTFKCQAARVHDASGFDRGLWHSDLGGHEDVYQTSFGDFTYTFLRFF